ncbi:hypothetical protein KC19_10G077600 [Ceratodon purpureus]|uniref:Fanconi anaemia group A protein arcN subdomain domain-containing protein n=1 Tax=Ceratodon purpureus TaxID=3225 RepID=A0A8T0GJ97_CERPU|nr:hypothetical protein KC19_10G077600 [Ceratodon purpureus]
MAAIEPLRLALTPFPALVASAAPSRIDRQLREIAAALAALLSPEETDAVQAAQEDAVHLLLDTFCRAHAEDHMSDHTKLGSWRLPYVAMLHSHVALHLPLIRQLEELLHSSGASLGPVQCSALSTFMLFMNPYQILRKDVTADVGQADDSSKDTTSDMHIASPRDEENVDDRPVGIVKSEKQAGNCHVKVLFTWGWEACFKAQSVARDRKEQEFPHEDGHKDIQMQGGTLEVEELRVEPKRSQFSESAEAGNHWMDQFCDAFLMDCETNILWATRFAASYMRNVAVYWEHVLFHRDCRETWLLSDLALQLKNFTLVGPIFVAFVPQNMVTFLIWLQQRLDFAFQFALSPETASLKKALALCETVLASPLGTLLFSTKISVSMSRFFELELRADWKEWALSKSRQLFLRHVVWGGSFTGSRDYFSWGLLWKDYGGDKTRACIALTAVFLTSQGQKNVESRIIEGQLSDIRSSRNDDDNMPKNSWSGTKKQCVRAETPDLQNLPQFLWLEESEASPAEVYILQIIIELSSKLDPQCGPWFLELAFDCLSNQARLENAILMHCETCACAHNCKSRLYNSGVCSAHRLKSCIAAVPPSHFISYERLYKMEKVFMFCWLGDGPFSIDFVSQLLSYFRTSQSTDLFLKAENRWSTLLLATWVRYFNVIGAPILSLHHIVGGINLGSVLSHLHTTQKFLMSNSTSDCPDIDGFKVAAMAMPQLAAVTLMEAMFTTYSCTNLSLREGFLAKLATEASQQQCEVSRRVEDIFRRITGKSGLQGTSISEDHKTVPEDGVQLFLKSILLNLVDLSSMAAICRPDLILKKWTAFEYKRKWVHEYKSSPIPRELQEKRASSQERSKTSLLSMASIELEFDERIGKPQRSMWDILLEWVISLITLYPYSISQLLLDTKLSDATRNHHLEAAGIIATGPKALTLIVVVSGLPRDTVLSLIQSSTTKASWTLLLSQMRTGVENEIRHLFLVDRKLVACDLSAMKAEIDLYLLQLQDIV